MDVQAANTALRDGSFQNKIQPVIEKLKPEATYFTAEGGKRTAYIFFQLSDPSQIPSICEPLFEVLRAEIELKPVMNNEELLKGLQSWAGRKAA
jgi:hypothetical protein